MAFYDADQNPPQTDALREYCTDVTALPRPIFAPNKLRAVGAFLSPLPRSVASTFDPVIHTQIQNIAARGKFAATLVIQLGMAPYAKGIEAPTKILDEIEAGIFAQQLRVGNSRERFRAGLTWWKFKRYVRMLASQFDALTVVSKSEQDLIHRIGVAREKISIVPNGVDCRTAALVSVPRETCMCIYNGALTYHANYDAMQYFVREILPLICAAEPRTRLRITGRADQVAQNELCDNNAVSFTGYVPEIKPLVAASTVCIVPLRVGGGTRLKILEAMALRTPVVATTKGAEGLDVQNGEHLLVADTPREFADAVLELFRNEALRDRLTQRAFERVCAKYDWEMIARQFEPLLAEHVQEKI